MAKKKVTGDDAIAKKKQFENIAGNIEEVDVSKFLQQNFLPYAWSFNLDRALVDVSGLKPVQRRILYTLYKEGLSPNANRSKVVTLAGSVLAYHPHGDTSVEDALKNLARGHVFRVPLIDGKGDFGEPGTPGSAPRYIEAKLSKAAWLCVEEISENAVRMVPNYDNTKTEPIFIPVKWPVSVINGGSGMGVGYAAKMPSHNPTEVMKAVKALLKNPDMTHNAIAKIIQGPDFGMGGVITSNDGIKEYLETGSGSFKIRGKYTIKEGARGTSRIEFHEIPYGSDPEKIISQIQTAIEKKGKFQQLATFKDLSDRTHYIRLVFETKPSSNAKQVLQELFAHTSLETSFSANMTTIIDSKPQVSSMKDLLLNFIEFRKLCIVKKSEHSLVKKNARIHLVDGLLKALLDIDAAIAIIRKSEDSDDANVKLQKKFKIDEDQASYVLSLQLKRLTKMDSTELKDENKKLKEEIKYLKELVKGTSVLHDYLLDEFNETLKIIGDERITEINDLSIEEFKESEAAIAKTLKQSDKNTICYITRFQNGTLLRTNEPFGYESTIKKIAHTPIIEQLKMKTQDEIVVVTNDGIGHKIPVSYIGEEKPVTMALLGLNTSKTSSIIGLGKVDPGAYGVGLAMATRLGDIKVSKMDFPKSSESFPVMQLADGDEMVDARWLGHAVTNTQFVMVSKVGQVLIFPAESVRASGHKAGGVKGMKLKGDDDAVIHFSTIDATMKNDNMLITCSNKSIKQTIMFDIPVKSRGGMGVATQNFKKGETGLINAYAGIHPVASLAKSTKNVVSLPPIVKRVASGVEFTIPVTLGSLEVVTE